MLLEGTGLTLLLGMTSCFMSELPCYVHSDWYFTGDIHRYSLAYMGVQETTLIKFRRMAR